MRRKVDQEFLDGLSKEELLRQAYAQAINLLSAREHSVHELSTKLSQRGFNATAVETTLAKVVELGYQSDDRFARLYAEQLFSKHYGPLGIRSKLNARGIDSNLIGQAISDLNADWPQSAADALLAKFGAYRLPGMLASHESVDKGKIARFLASRGFSTTDSLKSLRLAADLATQTVSE